MPETARLCRDSPRSITSVRLCASDSIECQKFPRVSFWQAVDLVKCQIDKNTGTPKDEAWGAQIRDCIAMLGLTAPQLLQFVRKSSEQHGGACDEPALPVVYTPILSKLLLGGSARLRGWRQGSSETEERTDRLWSGSLNRAHAPSRAKRPGGSERDFFWRDCRSSHGRC